jgi:hypothetical protein
MNFIGPLLHRERWNMQAAGSIEGVSVQSGSVAGLAKIEAGEFEATINNLTFSNLDAAFLDSTFTTTATLGGTFDRVRSVDLSLQGRLGRDTIEWAAKLLGLPKDMTPRAPLSLSRLRFTWKQGSALTAAGAATFGSGPFVSLDLRKSLRELAVNRLIIEDRGNTASVSLHRTGKRLDLTFQGRLDEETVNRMFERTSGHDGWVRGDLQAHLLFDSPRDSTARGWIAGGNLFFQPKRGLPITVQHIDLRANNKLVSLNTGSFAWGDMPFGLTGRIRAFEEGFHVDMDLAAGSLNLDRIQQLFSSDKEKGMQGPGSDQGKVFGPHGFQGTIRFQAKEITYGKYTFSPVKGNIFLDRQSIRTEITESTLCGISLPGHLQPLSEDILLDFEPAASGKLLEPDLNCLLTDRRITGTYTLSGRLHAKGKPGNLVRTLQGHVEFVARDGKIFRYPLLARILAFLNVTELLRGKLPDMGRDGFAYRKAVIKGDIRNGKLVLTEASLEGATLNLAIDGEIDFASNTIDVTVLVAPFKTLEYVLSRIPLIRNILANRLVTVPVRLKGNLSDPEVTPLDPEAVGEHVLNIMRRILELPFKVLDPLFGRSRK